MAISSLTNLENAKLPKATWEDLTSAEKESLKNLGFQPVIGDGSNELLTTYGRALIADKEFLDTNKDADLSFGQYLSLYNTWVGEAPLRQQERVASSTLDLSMENIPEIIAGGTARAAQGKKQRKLVQSTNPVVTALGLGVDSQTPAASNLLSLGIM